MPLGEEAQEERDRIAIAAHRVRAHAADLGRWSAKNSRNARASELDVALIDELPRRRRSDGSANRALAASATGSSSARVVRRRRDRDVTHRGRECRELRLDIDARAIPAQERMNGVRVAQIVDARKAPSGCADIVDGTRRRPDGQQPETNRAPSR